MLNAAVSQLISRRPAVHSTLWRPASQPHADNFQFSESLRKAFRNVVIIVTTPQSSPSAMSVAGGSPNYNLHHYWFAAAWAFPASRRLLQILT